MILVIFSALLRLMLIVLLYRLVTRYRDILSHRERYGAGFMGGSACMTLWVILDVSRSGTPFDVWAGAFFSFGATLFFWGFIERKAGHERRNERAKQEAHTYLAARGKL